MRSPSRTTPLEGCIQAAWQDQRAAARQLPGLLPALVHRQAELLPRFAASYTQLRTLPRRVRRALQRQWGLSLAGIALVLALGQSPLQAATIRVNARCTLVDAIRAANTDAARGECRAGRGADTIVLPAGSTQTLRRVHNSTYGPTGLPVISSPITIEGQGSTIVRASEAPEFRMLALSSTGELTLNETTVSGGAVPAPSSADDPTYRGGGMANYGGTVTVRNSTISGNAASGLYGYGGSGGGVVNSGFLTVINSTISGNSTRYGQGGGVANFDGTLTVTNSTISGNSAYDGGGGVYSRGGTVTVTHSTISGNGTSYGQGGGVANRSGILTVTTSTIADNFASDGGGMANGGTLTITNSTIAGNFAGRYGGFGGGVFNTSTGTLTMTNSTIANNIASGFYDDHGGGMVNSGTGTVATSTITGNAAYDGGGVRNFGPLTLTNSTISGNVAFLGGGVMNGGTLIVTNSTIVGNTVGRDGGGVRNGYYGILTLARTLVTGNTGPFGPELANGGIVFAANYNLFGVNGDAGVANFFPGATDIVPRAGIQLPDILDPTLANNGGPTQTHALVPGSPALDASPADADCAPTDQRGVRRPQGNGCDIGAFERRVRRR